MLNPNEERLQKVLARAGVASRRACEELIAAGRVRVNGKVVSQVGIKVDASNDKITLDDQPITVRPAQDTDKIYIMLNKPAGYLSTLRDPQGRPTIMDLLETEERLYPVGRLDMDTRGLLLLTNDGAFANTLMHPRYGLEKEYVALLQGTLATHNLDNLRSGVQIPIENEETGEREVYKTRPAKIEVVRQDGANTLVRFTIREGKKRQVRLMAQAIHHPVLQLRRVAYGSLRLGDLPEGKYRILSKAEVQGLLNSVRRASISNRAEAGQGAARFSRVAGGFAANSRSGSGAGTGTGGNNRGRSSGPATGGSNSNRSGSGPTRRSNSGPSQSSRSTSGGNSGQRPNRSSGNKGR
jgi:23S rRNA pseudouridine2605 synthase